MDDPDGQRFGLCPISLADKPLFDSAFRTLPQPISDYTFANTFIWGSSLDLYWRRLSGHLCVFANGTGDLTLLIPPVPEPGASPAELEQCLQQCFEIMDQYNERVDRSRSRIEYVSDEALERISSLKGLSLSATPMSGDYVYETARMIDLAGGALKSKRHARSKFQRDFPEHRTEALAPGHVPACLELLDLWRSNGDDAHEGEVNDSHMGSDILRHRESLACRRALEHAGALGLTGMVLLVGPKLVGFTLGEAVTSQQCSILVEKTHPDYPGSAQYIFSEFCRQYWSAYPECNVSDDWGVPSLRFTKQSYRPSKLLSKYTLSRQPVLVVGFSPLDVPVENPQHQVVTRGNPEPMVQAELRPALSSDVPGLLDLERLCFDSVEETFNRRQIRSLIRNPRATVTVAQAEGRIIGWAVGLVRQHRRGRTGRLYAVAVHPEARGHSLGRRLAQCTLERLGAMGIPRVYLEVRHDNETALHLYRKLGFLDRGELPNYYGPGRHGRRMCWLAAGAQPEVAAAVGAVLETEPTLWSAAR